MVKGISRGKFAAVHFYLGKLYQGDLRLHVNLFTTVTLISVFTQSFFRERLEGLSERAGYSVSKTSSLYPDGKKKHKPDGPS